MAYAAEQDIKLGVNYQYRYDGGCYRLARAVQAGAIGRVVYARINVPWHRDRSYFEGATWHQFLAQAGGGTLLTQASHLVDIALWSIGSPPVSASGYTARQVFKDRATGLSRPGSWQPGSKSHTGNKAVCNSL